MLQGALLIYFCQTPTSNTLEFNLFVKGNHLLYEDQNPFLSSHLQNQDPNRLVASLVQIPILHYLSLFAQLFLFLISGTLICLHRPSIRLNLFKNTCSIGSPIFQFKYRKMNPRHSYACQTVCLLHIQIKFQQDRIQFSNFYLMLPKINPKKSIKLQLGFSNAYRHHTFVKDF